MSEETNEKTKTPSKPEVTPEERKKTQQLAKLTAIIGAGIVIAPFFITGFKFGFLWYVLLLIVAFLAFAAWCDECKYKEDRGTIKLVLTLICAAGLAMYLWGPLNSNYSRNSYDDDSEYEDDYDDSDSAPSWIQGTWYCSTPYGDMQIEIKGNHIRESLGDGTSYSGTYHIQDDKIMPETGSHMYYKMEGHRLSAGQGYYFEKQ